MSDSRKSVIVISSHVACGSVGSRAAVIALQTMGYPVWAIPTVTLPWHPGHGSATKIIPDDDDFAAFINDIEDAPWINEVGAVLTGYMARESQVTRVGQFIETLKRKNPTLLYLCDPVIGDVGGLYVSKEIADSIRECLLPNGDIATPNRFELGWLTSQAIPQIAEDIIRQAELLGPEQVLVTSCSGSSNGNIGNLLWSKKEVLLAQHEMINNVPNGTGDLAAALYLAHVLSGNDKRTNLERTITSVFDLIKKSVSHASDELALELAVKSILEPQETVEVNKLG